MHFLVEAGAMLAVSLLLIASLTSVGMAVAGKILRGFSNPLFVPLAVAFGIPVHALIGLLVILLPVDKRASAAVLLLAVNIAALVVNVKTWPKWRSLVTAAIWPLALWIAASLLYGLVTFYPARMPDAMIDGPYIIKKDTLYTRIQSLVGDLPVDNQIPAIVSEYLLRGISFTKNHPTVPGQEVSDRPIMMSLVVVPVRALLGPVATGPAEVPKFHYYDKDWPDYSVLLDNTNFRQFLDVAVPLNATIIMGFWYLGLLFGLRRILPLASIALILLSPYVMLHCIFTWPKSLAAFYVILATLVVYYRQPAWLAGVLLGLGYWSHAYARVFAGTLGLYYLIEYYRKRAPLQNAIHLGGAFVLITLPWYIWTRFIIQLPSDMIEQNIFRNITSVSTHVWLRLYNLTILLFPVAFGTPNFAKVPFVRAITDSLVGMMGLPFFLPGLYALFHYMKQYWQICIYSVIMPGLLLIAVFSMPIATARHGWQAISPILLVMALKLLQEKIPMKALAALIILQGVINLWVIDVYAHERTPHCPEKMDKCTIFGRLSGHS